MSVLLYSSKTEAALKNGLSMSSRSVSYAKTWSEARARLKPRTRHISDELSAYMNDHKEPKKDTSAAISIPSNGSSSDDMSFSFGCYPIHGQFNFLFYCTLKNCNID